MGTLPGMRSPLLAAAAFAILLGACGSNDTNSGVPTIEEAPLAIVANAPGTLTVGSERLLLGLIAPDTANLALPDRQVDVDLVFGGAIVATVPGEFMWTVPDVRGMYRVAATFDQPGTWAAIVRSDDLEVSVPTQFQVTETSTVPDIGDRAPLSATPTGAEFELEEISTDPSPEPRFYELSLDEALTNGTPTVVVFSTPAFCQTATCGPTLDIVKDVAAEQQGVDFVHVEVYTNLDAGSVDELELAPAVTEWRLPSEPWVFVVDGNGIITAAFEGALGPEEIQAALASL